jgi:hypothetical protein
MTQAREENGSLEAAVYHRVFEGHHEGAQILAELTRRFYDVDVYTPGGLEGQRETDRKAARREVIHFILVKLSQVNVRDPNADEPPAA